jgi:hypothetical protein
MGEYDRVLSSVDASVSELRVSTMRIEGICSLGWMLQRNKREAKDQGQKVRI